MAIQDKNAENTNFGSNEFQASSGSSHAKNFASFHSGSLFGAPISLGTGSEGYTKLKQALIDHFKTAHTSLEVAILDMDNINNSQFKYSTLIVALRLKGQEDRGVAYHLLVVAATGDELTPINDTINGHSIEIMRVPSDAVDSILINAAQERVAKSFLKSTPIFVDATVIPASFNVEDKTLVHKIALNAGMACMTELQVREKDFADLNLAGLTKDSTLQISHAYGRQNVMNAVGDPIRSDVRVTFDSKKNSPNGRQVSINSGDKEIRVTEMAGYIDLIWSPTDVYNGFNPWVSQPMTGMFQLPTQKYAARLNITDINSGYAYTPATMMLAIATALTVGDANNWMQTYRPTPENGKVDLNDIGFLNIEANGTNDPSGWGPKIRTKDENFKLAELGQFIQKLIRPGMLVALDCPEYGPQAWYMSPFAGAAAGSAAAYDVLYQAANELTDGHFSRLFPHGTPMFVDTGNRVHTGYWVDRTNVKRDLRDFDHLAACVLHGESNPNAIRDWADTFLRVEYPLLQRLHARKRMIMAMSGETAVFTGFAQRVTFSGKFLAALAQGVKETALAVKVTTPLSASDLNNARGVGLFVNDGMMIPGMTFTQGGMYTGQAVYNGYGNGRW